MKLMKVVVWLLLLTASASAQTLGLKVCETGASPSVCKTGIKEIYVTPGTLTISGQKATLDISGGGGGGAPTNATYITQTANGSLSAEQALSGLASGIMRVATTTGVVTSLTDSAGIAANISDETGTGALVFGTSPDFTTGATIGGVAIPTISSTNTFTNKTLTASSNVLGGVTMTLGSDADGDMYYRASNVLTRLAKGTAGQCLQMNGGATAPTWGSCGGASGITIGTTTITSGTGGRFLYEASGNVVGEISTLTSDGTIITFAPTVTTGTGATAGVVGTANSLTAGNGFDFSSSSVSSGNVFRIAATGTAAASNTKTALNVSTSGANTTGTQTTFGAQISNASTGTSSTNIGLRAVASGGTTNYDLQLGDGSQATAFLSVNLSGANDPKINFGNAYVEFDPATTSPSLRVTNTVMVLTGRFGFGASTTTQDVFMRRLAAASFLWGDNDSAVPTAQTQGVQSVSGGISNTAGADWTFSGSRGTGTGAGGGIIFQTAPAGSSGTSQNSLSEAFRINNYGGIRLKSVTFANLPGSPANGDEIFCSDCAQTTPYVDTTCVSGGSGAKATRINGAWKCFN